MLYNLVINSYTILIPYSHSHINNQLIAVLKNFDAYSIFYVRKGDEKKMNTSMADYLREFIQKIDEEQFFLH